MFFGYQSYLVAVCTTFVLVAGLSLPASAQDPIGACCHEGDAPVENASKGMMVAFCEELSQIDCTEPHINPQWFGAGTACGLGPFETVEECGGEVVDLPVELSRFEALVEDGSVALVWSTVSETNNAGFAVEQELGTDVFTEIGFVEGNGTTQEKQEYNFVVSELDPGVHRFRLRQIDFDGAFHNSPVVEAAITVPERFLIEPAYPNPFNPSTMVRFAVAVDQQVDVRLVNAAGQLVRTLYSGTVAANQLQTVSINAATLSSGTYLVQFRGNNGLEATETIVLAK